MNKKKWVTSLLALSLVSSFSAAPVFADGGHGKKDDNGRHLGWYKQQIKVNFEDIDDNFSWARQSILKLAEEGIIAGMDSTHFQPAGKLNRAQFSVLVSRFFGLQPANGTQEDFLDVHNGDWYFRDIEAAKDYMTWFTDGNGYDFRPNQAINRAEAAVTLVQLLMKNNSIQLVSQSEADQILSVYKDAYEIPQNLRIHVATAVKAGVISGVATDRFDPLSTLNRAQAATLLYRLQTSVVNPTTGQPIEIVPGQPGTVGGTNNPAPVVTYASSSYTLPVGNTVTVSTSEPGAVYLIPAGYSPTTVSDLDSLVNSNIGVKTTVGQAYTNVGLYTGNLAAGSYVIYATDYSGNVSRFSNTISLTSTGTTDTTGPTVSYASSSYTLPVGNTVTVNSSETGAVYLIPAGYSPTTVSDLDSLVNSNIGVKTTVGQAYTNVGLYTGNLAAGSYVIYATDSSGNVSRFGNTISLTSTGTTDTTGPALSYLSSSYNLVVGNQVNVSSNEMGTVYLVPVAYSPTSVTTLDQLYDAKLAAKSIIGQTNTNVALSTSNLAAGDYRIFAVDLSGNISSLSQIVHLSN